MPSPQPQALGEGSAGAQASPVKVSPGILAGTTRKGTFKESLKLTVANCATGGGSPSETQVTTGGRRTKRESERTETLIQRRVTPWSQLCLKLCPLRTSQLQGTLNF